MQLSPMSGTQVTLVALLTGGMVGWAAVLIWPTSTAAPIIALGLLGVIAVMWWQAWPWHEHKELRDVVLANAAIAAAMFLLLAEVLAEVVRECSPLKPKVFYSVNHGGLRSTLAVPITTGERPRSTGMSTTIAELVGLYRLVQIEALTRSTPSTIAVPYPSWMWPKA